MTHSSLSNILIKNTNTNKNTHTHTKCRHKLIQKPKNPGYFCHCERTKKKCCPRTQHKTMSL